MSCKSYQDELAESLFGGSTSAELKKHIAGCAECAEEAKSLRATMDLLGEWQAPEPTAYFDQKMTVLLREERAKAPAGFFERLREYLQLSTGRQFRPALAGGLALVLVLGGGGYAGVTVLHQQHEQAQASAAVNDLQILDKNEQALQQMDQLLDVDDDGPGPDGSDQPAS
jgi:anti-sigma factor RsiW